MKLIKPSYKILTKIDWNSVLKQLEYIGRVSFQSHDRITETSHHRFVENLIKLHHDSILEFFDITVEFTINRAMADELRTYRCASHLMESTRHVSYKDGITFVIPDWITDINEGVYIVSDKIRNISDVSIIWLNTMTYIETRYKKLIEEGKKPEEARDIVPYGSLKCTHVIKCNLREWRHILEQRCNKSTLLGLRRIMLSLLDDFNNKLPEVFADIYGKVNNE